MGITADEQMVINEINKQGRVIAAETKRIKDLNERSQKLGNYTSLNRRPAAYTVEFSFAPGDKTAKVEPFTITGEKFFAHSVSTAFSAVGQAAVDTNPGGAPIIAAGQLANITMGEGLFTEGPSARSAFFDYFWNVRDTGSDFSMQDVDQPSVVLASGHASPAVFPTPAVWEIGSTIEVSVDPFFSRSELFGVNVDGLFAASEYRLLFKFWGESELAS